MTAGPRRRWWVLAGGGLGGLVGLALLGAGASWLWLRTPTGSAWLAPRIAQAITPVGGEAAIGRLHTNGWNRITLTDVHLVLRPELGGEQIIHVGRIQARLEPMALIRGRVVLHGTSLEGVFIDMTPSETVSTEPFVGLGVELEAHSVDVRSLTVVYRNPDGEPLVRVVGAHGSGHVHAIGDAVHLRGLDLGGWLAPLGGTPARLTGDAVYDNDGIHLDSVAVRLPSSQLTVDGLAGLTLDLDVGLAHLDGRDTNAALGNVGLHGALSGSAHLGGTSSVLTYAMDLEGADGTRGSVQGSGEVDLTGERIRWTSDLNLNQLAVHDLVPEQVDTVTMSGRLVLEGTGTQYPSDLDLTGAWTGRGDIYGNVLEDVEVNFAVSEGLVRLTDTGFDGILGELTVSGEVHAVDGPMDLVVEGMLSPARLREFGVDSVDAPGWVRARLTGDALDSEAPLTVAGTVRFAPFQSGPDIAADEVTAAFQATQQGERTDGEATWDAIGLTAYGVEIAAIRGDSTPFSSGPEGFQASGLAHATAVVMPDTFTVSNAEVTWSTSSVRGDRTEAQIAIGSHDLLTFPGTDGRVRAELLGDDLRLSVRLNDGPRALLHTSGTANMDTSTYALDTLTLGLTPRATWDAKRPVRFTLSEHGLNEADIALSGNLGTAVLTGTVGTKGPLDGHLRLTGFSLDTLAELDPESASGLAGILDLDLTLSGRASNPNARALWKVDGLWVEDTTRWLDAEGRVDVADGQLTTTVRLGVAGTLLAHMHGTVPLNSDLADPGLALDEPMDLSVAIVGGPLKRLSQAFPSVEGLPEGDIGGAMTLSGLPRDPRIRLAGVASLGVPGWPNRARVEFDLTRNGPGLSGWVDVRDGYEARLHLGGFGHTDVGSVFAHLHEHGALPDEVPLDTWASRLSIQGTFADFPARSLTAAADLPVDVSGVLVGGFGVRGSLESPELDASIQWIRGALGRQPMPLANLELAAEDNGYDLTASMDFGERKLTLRGALPIQPRLSESFESWSSGEMSLIVEGQVPLQALTAVNGKLTGIEGDLTLKGGIRGAPHNPKPALVATVEQGTLAYNPLGLRAQSIDLRLVAHPQEIRLDQFRVQTVPGRRRTLASSLDDISDGPPSLFEAQGRATLNQGEIDRVTGTVNLSGGTWVMNTSETVLRVDGALDIAGQWPALQVGGQLALHSGNILLDAAAFLDRAPLEPDSRIRLLREGVVSTRPAEAEAPWYEAIEANVDLRLGRSLELAVGMPFVDDLGALGAAVSRADLTARLGGEVSLGLSNSQPTLIGEVDLAEGTLRMLRSRFSLNSGTLLFTGNDYSEPNMDIRATMTVADAEINTHVTGTPSRPRFESQSEQYPDQSTILMIMLTGRSPDENSNASTEAMPQALAGLVLDSLLGAQNLGNVSLSSDGTVRVGAPISPSLYATVVASPSSDIVDNHLSGEVEWNIAPKVVLASSVGDVTSWLDLYWEIRF